VLAVPLAAAVRSRLKIVRFAARLLIDLIRSVPPLVWLFIIFYGLAQAGLVTLKPFPAAVGGLGLVTAAYMAEIYRSGLLAVRPGQWEAAEAVGLSRPQAMRAVIAPQALRVVIPSAATYAIGLLKDTAVISIIGVADITLLAAGQSQQGDALGTWLLAGVLYIALSVPIAIFARWRDRVVNDVLVNM
jgi:polar amino acid transport system permease protein